MLKSMLCLMCVDTMSKKVRKETETKSFDSRLRCTAYGPAIAVSTPCLSPDVIVIIARYAICPEPLPESVLGDLQNKIYYLDVDRWIKDNTTTTSFRDVFGVVITPTHVPIPRRVVHEFCWQYDEWSLGSQFTHPT